MAAGGKTLLATDAGKADAAWVTLPCEKEIDALAVQADRLLALDNIVMPKWHLIFDLTEAGAGDPARIQLPVHGTYEEIEGAVYWDGRFAVLSRTVGMMGVGKHLWLLDGESYGEVGHAYSFEASFDPRFDEGFLPLIWGQGHCGKPRYSCPGRRPVRASGNQPERGGPDERQGRAD